MLLPQISENEEFRKDLYAFVEASKILLKIEKSSGLIQYRVLVPSETIKY